MHWKKNSNPAKSDHRPWSATSKRRITPLLVILWVLGLFPSVANMGHTQEVSPSGSTQSNLNPPKEYDFGTSEAIVDIGVQPLWFPSGIITEVIRHDAILERQLQQLGKKLRFHPFFKGADVNLQIHHGNLEGGIGGDMPAIWACVADQVRIVSLTDYYFTAIVAPKPVLLPELRGQRIGYALGSNAHYALLSALRANNLTESDVTLVPMEANAMPQALEQGTIDAFSAWEPTPTMATYLHSHHIIHKFLSSGYLYFSHLFAERYPEIIHLIIAAQFRALNWLTASDKNFSQALSWSNATIRQFQGYDFALPTKESLRLGHSSIRHLQAMPVIPEDDLLENGHIGQAVHFLKHIGKLPTDLPWKHVAACFHREDGTKILSAPTQYRLDTFDYADLPP
ncbi:MAG: NrtA/SsuA/CpmA family ABC transporter substrate-binding protein [Magnetococcus sp. THC-1_WYH]